jgi:L-ascorbate metabolism protein UlaG (beta-lactamase superfamily)
MEITWLGHSCFRIKAREGVILMDPPQKKAGFGVPKQTANLVTISHDHPGHGNRDVGGSPMFLDAPGEYEVSGVLVTGVQTYHDAKKGEERGRNIAFTVEAEGIRVCHLGDIGHVPSADEVEDMGNIQILLVPVGGNTTVDAAQAAEIVTLLEPRVIVPMHYKLDGNREDLAGVDRFLKEMGASGAQPQAKLTYSRSGLPSEPRVELLEPRR